MPRSLLLLATVLLLAACTGPRDAADTAAAADSTGDSAFAALQARGAQAMGVDQYTSTHRFDPLPDGGRIELQRNEDDPAGAATIRAHLRHIANRFADGDFAVPGLVHSTEVPGTRVMASKRAAISYTFAELPRGGEVRIITADSQAVAAVHAFLAFQRREHRTEHHAGHR